MTLPRKTALILSPFGSLPMDAGQRRRAVQSTRVLGDRGYRIHYLHYAFEEGWKVRHNDALHQGMGAQWDEVSVVHAKGRVGLPPLNGQYHMIDEWWDEGLGAVLRNLFERRHYDVLVVHNVWLSKAFDLAPRRTTRILDMHDVFSERANAFRKAGTPLQFYYPDEEQELFGLARADLALAIQDLENGWLARKTGTPGITLPYFLPGAGPHPAPAGDAGYLHEDRVVFGFFGSGHPFDVQGLRAYASALRRLVGETGAPVELVIGGSVGAAVAPEIVSDGLFRVIGYVEDERDFFQSIDVLVAPVFNGSGFAVKTADSLAAEKPMLLAAHSAIGLDYDRTFVFDSPEALAWATVRIALARPPMRTLRAACIAARDDLAFRAAVAAEQIDDFLKTHRTVALYDLSGLSASDVRLALLWLSGAFHLLKYRFVQIVRVDTWDGSDPHGDLEPGVTIHAGDLPPGLDDRVAVRLKWAAATGPGETGGLHVDFPGLAGAMIDAPQAVAAPGIDRPVFWHSLTWDPFVRRLVSDLGATAAAPETGRDGGSLAVLLMPGVRRSPVDRIAGNALFGSDMAVYAADSDRDRVRLVHGLMSGTVRRVVVVGPADGFWAGYIVLLARALGVAVSAPFADGELALRAGPDGMPAVQFAEYERRFRDELFAALDRSNARDGTGAAGARKAG